MRCPGVHGRAGVGGDDGGGRNRWGGGWVLARTPDEWRLWTKQIRPDAARAAVSISGDRAFGLAVLDAVAIIG